MTTKEAVVVLHTNAYIHWFLWSENDYWFHGRVDFTHANWQIGKPDFENDQWSMKVVWRSKEIFLSEMIVGSK